MINFLAGGGVVMISMIIGYALGKDSDSTASNKTPSDAQ